jgi:LmbE family N-acetylglucosaminyl deacetylase
MKPLSRRSALGQASLLGGALAAATPLAAAASQAQKQAASVSVSKLKVIVTGGHPGDPEYGCGGTIARYTDLGHEVVLLYLNDGEWPPGEPATGHRAQEAQKACEILKARPLYAGQINSRAVVDAAHYDDFRKLLEAEKPDVVFTHWPLDNHADHRAISMLTYGAWLKMRKSFTLYYYEVSSGEDTVQFSPTHYVDIRQTEPRKRQACYAHASQTPDRYYALQVLVTRMRGVESARQQAEGYIRHVQSPGFSLPGM